MHKPVQTNGLNSNNYACLQKQAYMHMKKEAGTVRKFPPSLCTKESHPYIQG
jgi:hypothetical protein